jgi:hypothetical protein
MHAIDGVLDYSSQKYVSLSQEMYRSNELCLGSSLSQLIDVLFEINFPVINIKPTVDSLMLINGKL